ncbi:dnaJ homolog subfamily C member 22-like [Asterias amurensis]|uniref:dnaJ homolog subfamily C member 22-like n=1 Tax=Asterias amurensis TaxID=7602 RepID=UPI003AB88088
MAKNLFVAYVLWWFLGWLGVHHFYLGRDRHAFVWWATGGGIFRLGWFRDLWRLPSYVDSANEEPYYMERLTEMIRIRKSPPFNPSRFIGQACFGTFLGHLSMLAISEDFAVAYPIVRSLVVPFCVAIGVHIVGNIGRETGHFKWAIVGAVIPALKLISNPHIVVYMALLSAILFQRDRSFKRKPSQRGLCSRLFVLFVAGSMIMSLWGSALYFNASVTTSDGETIRFRDAVDHFFGSPIWKEFKETIKALFHEGWEKGWENMWSRFVQSLDPEGEQNAYQVLGLSKGVTQAEITKRYRTLVREMHPDKIRNGNKEEAAAAFMKIQSAYETLSKIKEKRARRQNYRKQKEYEFRDM